MAKRTHRSLAHLERELHAHDAKRHSILAEIAAAVESLGIDAMYQIARIGQETGLGASLPENVAKPKPARKARTKAKSTTRSK